MTKLQQDPGSTGKFPRVTGRWAAQLGKHEELGTVAPRKDGDSPGSSDPQVEGQSVLQTEQQHENGHGYYFMLHDCARQCVCVCVCVCARARERELMCVVVAECSSSVSQTHSCL